MIENTVRPAIADTSDAATADAGGVAIENTASTRSDKQQIASLQVEWIMGWDKAVGQVLPSFERAFGKFYDFDAPVILFDDFDIERRVFLTARAYGNAFWPEFSRMRSAEHAIETQPDVLVHGDLAATMMVFIAVLTLEEGTVIANRCTTSQVWRRGSDRNWRISRDHTGVVGIAVDEARRAFAH